MNNETQKKQLDEFLQTYYDGSFSRMACDYIHATGDDGGRSGSFVEEAI